MSVQGSCLCESVKYELEGEPVRFNFCHCNNCAKATGAEAGHFLFFNEKVRLVEAIKSITRRQAADTDFLRDPQQFTYSENPSGIISTYADTKTESGNTLMRRFCSRCGSTLWITCPQRPGVYIVPYGGIENPSKEWKPTHEVFCRHKKSWVHSVAPEQEQ